MTTIKDLSECKRVKHCINGKFYNSIKAIYKTPEACVQVNSWRTGWLPTPFRVQQGDVLSPSLFALCVNDLVQDIRSANMGVSIEAYNLSILLYVDHTFLIAEEENKLQSVLNIMNDCSTKWRLIINCEKLKSSILENPQLFRVTLSFILDKIRHHSQARISILVCLPRKYELLFWKKNISFQIFKGLNFPT